MKVRTDFVSNSSSCSFVLRKENGGVRRALEAFAKTFAAGEVPWAVSDKVNVGAHTRNRDFSKVFESVNGEPPPRDSYGYRGFAGEKQAEYQDEVSWESVELQLDGLETFAADHSDVVDLVEDITFTTSDGDVSGMLYLRLLYLFFERNGCMPDATETEHAFVGDSFGSRFFNKLCTASWNPSGERPEKAGKSLRKKKGKKNEDNDKAA